MKKNEQIKAFILCLLITFCIVLNRRVVHADVTDYPIIIKGSELALFAGKPVGLIYVLVYENEQWKRIPFQLDERYEITLNTCLPVLQLPNYDQHLTYQFSDERGDGLTDEDEIVFMVGDGMAAQAPLCSWPKYSQLEDIRYEVKIHEAHGLAIGYCYIYSATSVLPVAGIDDYVNYDFNIINSIIEDTNVDTDYYSVHYSARWRLDQVKVKTLMGGSNTDMIDRVKHRVIITKNGYGLETEQTWGVASCFLGHKDGLIRVIREVQGSASGVNTTQTTYFYKKQYIERVNLRVHSLSGPAILTYIDFNASTNPLTYYSHNYPSGVTIDGIQDTLSNSPDDWSMVSHSSMGSLFSHFKEVKPIPARLKERFWWDDSGFNDQTGDDEPGRYGCPGIKYTDIEDTDNGNEAVVVTTTIISSAGADYADALDLALEMEYPPYAELKSQSREICDNPTPKANDSIYTTSIRNKPINVKMERI